MVNGSIEVVHTEVFFVMMQPFSFPEKVNYLHSQWLGIFELNETIQISEVFDDFHIYSEPPQNLTLKVH